MGFRFKLSKVRYHQFFLETDHFRKTFSKNTKHFDYSDTPHISPLTKKFGLFGSISA